MRKVNENVIPKKIIETLINYLKITQFSIFVDKNTWFRFSSE